MLGVTKGRWHYGGCIDGTRHSRISQGSGLSNSDNLVITIPNHVSVRQTKVTVASYQIN